MRHCCVFLTITMIFCVFSGLLLAENESQEISGKEDNEKELKLETMIPEKSVFGPSASRTAFSYDGKYGAYLYRPYLERRHGNDLWIYDCDKGKSTRITSATIMAAFQKSSRKVVEDRTKKAEKKEKDSAENTKKSGEKESLLDEANKENKTDNTKSKDTVKKSNKESADDDLASHNNKGTKGKAVNNEDAEKIKKNKNKNKEQQKLGDVVDKDDADAKNSPRYAGVSSYQWSPVSNELLFVSDGDIYRYKVGDDKPVRLTRTVDTEESVSWLNDGSGYIFKRGERIFQVQFKADFVQQINPKFPEGEQMVNYQVSPDDKQIAFLTSKTTRKGNVSTVFISDYDGDRLMKAKEVKRRVSDDVLEIREIAAYIYQIGNPSHEDSVLTEVLREKKEQPDDMVHCPVWSGDSKKIAILVFKQDTGVVKIMESEYPDEIALKKKKDEKPLLAKEKDSKLDDNEKGKETKNKDTAEDEGSGEIEPDKAKEIYRYMHTGGPNTPRMMKLYYMADNRRILYTSEQTGFRHVHVLEPLYESFISLTRGRYEVYPLDITRDRKWLFVEATKEHPSRRDAYRINLETFEMTRMTQDKGTHSSFAVSPDGSKILANLVSFDFLKELIFIDTQNEKKNVLTDSHPEKAKDFAIGKPEFFSYNNRHGHTIYGNVFKPDDWKEDDKRPLLIYFYGGPLGTRKMVVEGSYSSNTYGFPYYMAKKHGWVCCTIDTRGNSGYAGVFEKANFGQVGRPQVEDLVDGVKYLVANHGVDPDKVAIHGWSFGGFQTQMCMYTEPDVFAVGIAGAGPTEWENYNSWYTRHTIGKSKPGQANLKEFSLLPLAKNLKGKLLLVHGVEDSNVLYQDTVRVYRELLKAKKETLVELFIDPTGGHGLGGDVKSQGRYRKYEDFLLRTIGIGKGNLQE